jgi:hypothetical protein
MNKLILFMFLYECIGFSYASEIRVFKYIAMAEAMASVGNVVEGVPDFLEVGYYEIGRKGFVVVNRNYKGECIIMGILTDIIRCEHISQSTIYVIRGWG